MINFKILIICFLNYFKSEFKIYYDLKNVTRAVSIAYLGPSITTESFLNPGYRIYTVDGFYKTSSWQVLDFETKYLNLTEANIYNATKWRTEYAARVRENFYFSSKFK